MSYLLLSPRSLFLALSASDAWIPSKGFLYCVLVIGALFLAAVVLSAFTFYEDHYWADIKYREELRFNSSRRN